jgi:small subunit ribosomal protein S5
MVEAVKEFEEKIIALDRVTRVVKGGRRFRFRATVVVGNGKDKVGVGVGKGQDVQTAIAKAVSKAKKAMITVDLKDHTIPHETQVTFGGATVFMKPASAGTGVIAGGSMRAVLEAAGITDVLAKSLGSANPHNVVKATFKALATLREPIAVSKTRSISLKKVFNG